MPYKKLRVLASASDAGGAANVAPVLKSLSKRGSEVILIKSNSTHKIFEKHGVNASYLEKDFRGYQFLDEKVDELNPNIIITGTTRYESIDRNLICASLSKKIQSLTILDEWYNYSLRFKNINAIGHTFPDIICCQDQLAFNEAVQDGLPASNLRITGNPALTEMWNLRENFHKYPPAKPNVLIDLPRPIILFLSETHSEDYGIDERGGPLGPFLGYTEISVLQDIYEILIELGHLCSLVEKMHPSALFSGIGLFNSETENVEYLRLSDYSLHELIWNADIIIGMRSMAILEAALMGKPVISFQPNLRKPYGASTAERLGIVASIRSSDQLKSWFRASVFSDKSDLNLNVIEKRPEFARKDTINNIVNVILEVVDDT